MQLNIEHTTARKFVITDRLCVSCGEAPTIGRAVRCQPCRRNRARAAKQAAQILYRKRHPERVKASQCAYFATPAGRAYKRRKHREYQADNREKKNAHNRVYRLRHPERAKASNAKWRARHKPRRQALAPVVAWQTGGNVDLAAINAAVPRGIPGREDICQSLALGLLEGTITRDTLAAHVRKQGAAFRRDNFEGRGFAVSLSEPRHDGRSWDDILADDTGRAWV